MPKIKLFVLAYVWDFHFEIWRGLALHLCNISFAKDSTNCFKRAFSHSSSPKPHPPSPPFDHVLFMRLDQERIVLMGKGIS